MTIYREDGRWKTTRTDAEQLESFRTSVKKLSKEEREFLRSVLRAPDSASKPLAAMRNLEYEEQPCPPEKFLADPLYFGEIGKGIYKWIWRELPNVFKYGYDQIVCTGAQRTGKDTFGQILTSYLVHMLLCLKDPCTSYGLAKGSNIYIVCMSATQELAREALFNGVVEKLKQSPWFNKYGKSIKYLTEEIRFPKGIILKGAESGDMGVVGLNTCEVIIDEANLGRKIKAVHEKNQSQDRTEAIYQAVRRRIRTTFSRQGGPPTFLMTLGSRRYPSDFVERRIKELQNDKKALVMDMSLWEAKGRENFSEKSFQVAVGNEQTASRILKEGELTPKGMEVINVPEDFRADFEGDCDGALRDIAGIAVRTISPFFANQDLVYAAIDDSRSHPVKTIEWQVDKPLQIDWDKLVTTRDGRMVPQMYPDKHRCVAVDLGRVKNPTGFAVGFIKGFRTVSRKDPNGRIYQENLPVIVVEFILRISPVQGQEVKFYQVRELVFDLISHGIPIKMAVLDHWQSDDFCQLLKDQGIDASQVKTDIKAYDTFKNAVYEKRFRTYNYKPFIDELMLLEHDPRKRKIDIISEDMGNLHHDVADAACLLVNRLSSGFNVRDYDPVAPEADLPKRQGFETQYQTVAAGDTPFEYTQEEKELMMSTSGQSQPAPDSPNQSIGFLKDEQELGWGEEFKNQKARQEQGYIVPHSNAPIRVEKLAGDFCSRVGIDKVQFVTVASIKAFLFEKALMEPGYVTAIKKHIETVYEKEVR